MSDQHSSSEHVIGAAADDLEDGAYVVLDEEDEEGSPEHEQAKPADRASNGGNAEPMSTEDDRYVATAYDADEEQNRCPVLHSACETSRHLGVGTDVYLHKPR